jgi:N-methylhydantoinase A
MERRERGPLAPWRIGVDVGGTFTDLVLADANGDVWVAKVPSVPSDPSRGVLAALDRLAADLRTSTRGVLAGCSVVIHGSTVATNTMLEGKGAQVGLLTTAGFRDALEIRRGLRENQWDHRAPYPPVLVPRYLRLPVGGRVAADGRELDPIDTGDVAAAAATFAAEGVESVAVALFNSFRNPDHEVAAVAELGRLGAAPWVTGSAALAPIMGEYERTSTAVVNAALAPRIVTYLRRLDGELQRLGLARPLLLVQSNGGAASVDALADRPVNLLLSGPAAGVGALNLYRGFAGTADLISMEIGGTSCDVLLMSNGQVAARDEFTIGGYHVAVPTVDIHTIGAGGGTIAGVDSAGMLFVGPQGAGADPGPASYGFGGSEPTVTDAQLVLGRLRPGPYAGGAISLDLGAAREAIQRRVAGPLGLDVESAAAGIITLVEQHLLHAVEYLSIERGHSPSRFTFVAAGGAGPMHGATVGRSLGCSRVYIPRQAGAFCALGMLAADLRQDFLAVLLGSLDELHGAEVLDRFATLEQQAAAAMAAEGIDSGAVTIERAVDLRYTGQLWSIRVPAGPAGACDAAAIRARFEAEYRRLYGHIQPGGVIAVSSLRVSASASTGVLTPPRPRPGAGVPAPVETRKVWHGAAHGWLDTAVYVGADLLPGHRLAGPLLVEEVTTTVLAGPDDTLAVDRSGNFVVSLDPAEVRSAPAAAAPGMGAGDPIVLALMQHRLDQISKHMGWVMTRTARSPIFSQSHDFSCFVTGPDGTLVANADGIPIHTGGGGFAVRAVLAKFGGRIGEGDVFLLSDPYVAGGNHLPDWVITRPVFVGPPERRTLAGFCCNRAHQSDIGGGLAGTYNPEATEIWHEGIRLPVLKLAERGVIREDLWELLLLNSRTDDLLDGDLRAMLGSTQIGAERVAALVEELGLDGYLGYLAGICDHADRRFREAIAALPDGVYVGEERIDNDCFGPADLLIRATVTKVGDRLTIDFGGSSGQIRGFKNSSLANTYSATYLALSSFFDPDLPRNEGTYRAVEIIAPEGTLTNARPPAPMTMNTVFVAWEIVHALWKALAQADPARACAGWGKTMHGHVAGTTEAGRSWVMYQWHAMGTAGATSSRDGFAQMGHLISLGGLDLPNLEFYEQLYPVRYRRWELRCDAAGPGERRGGSGVHYEADIVVPATWSFRCEGLDTPSGYGVQGGGDGLAGLERIEPVDSEGFVPPKYGVRRLGPARMVAATPGGGGWGDPLRRDPALVLRDVRDGVVSVEAAQRDYGVVIGADGRSVDVEATASWRAAAATAPTPVRTDG